MHGIYVDGAAILFRLHDVAYTLDLERAAELLAPSAPERVRPTRAEAQALQIKNLPVNAFLGSYPLSVRNVACSAQVSVRLFDFGVCSMRAEINAPGRLSWQEYGDFAAEAVGSPAISALIERELAQLLERLAPATERAALSRVKEQYVVYRMVALRDSADKKLTPDVLTDDDIASLMLREPRDLSDAARRKLLPHRFSFYHDDLAVLTWDSALIVEPALQDRDVEYVVEFANAQLLQLRVYDEMLDAALPVMYDNVAAVRGRRSPLLRRKYRPVLVSLQTLVADVTETVEHSDNALKVTDDVYLADIYDAALRVFRSGPWRAAIERKLTIVRDTYAMLDAEAQAARAELLEIAIVVIILAEFIRSLF
jgi:hypothetical protein